MIKWETKQYFSDIGYSKVIFQCGSCNTKKWIRSSVAKRKVYDLCHNCYQKSPERKIAAKKCVENRPSYDGKSNPNYRNAAHIRVCPCGNQFETYHKKATFCSNKCKGIYCKALKDAARQNLKTIIILKGSDHPKYNKIEQVCKCGKHFLINPHRLRHAKVVHCSKECAHRFKSSISKFVEYEGIKYRSQWEVEYAKYLNSLGYSWTYEPRAFVTPFGYYTPDFWVEELQSYVR